METGWATGVSPSPTSELGEIYRIESQNPPFVGSKTTVFSPSHKLAQDFLELSLPEKLQVARVIGTSIGLPVPEDSDLFRAVFSEASLRIGNCQRFGPKWSQKAS